MEKIGIVLEKINDLLERRGGEYVHPDERQGGRAWGELKKDHKQFIGVRDSKTGKVKKQRITIKKGTHLEVYKLGLTGSFTIYILSGPFAGVELRGPGTGTGSEYIDYKNERKLHKKYSPSYPLYF